MKPQKSVRPVFYIYQWILVFLLMGAASSAPVYAQEQPNLNHTEMKVRLNDTIDTSQVREGDTFEVTVLNPARFADAVVEGTIDHLEHSGKFKGQTVLTLSFDRIRLADGKSYAIQGHVLRVYDAKTVKDVDEDGNLRSDSRGASTAKRTAGAAAGGAILGVILGGGKGAAIGAGTGAGIGAGSNAVRDRNKIRLEAGTEMLIFINR